MGKNHSRVKRMMIRHLNLFGFAALGTGENKFLLLLAPSPTMVINFTILFLSLSRLPFPRDGVRRKRRKNSFRCFFNTSSTGFLEDRRELFCIGNMDK